MARFGLIGGSYSSQSVIADCQRTMDWIPEMVESGQGQSQMALYPRPGLTLFAPVSGPPPAEPLGRGPLPPGFSVPASAAGSRGCLAFNGMAFFVIGAVLYQVSAAGVLTRLGAVGNDGKRAYLATNGSAGNQLLVSSAGNLYLYYLPTSKVTPSTFVGPLASLQGNAAQMFFCDGYFVAALAGTNKFQISALEDGSTWNPLSVQQVSVFPENVGGMAQAYRQLWLFGLDGHAQVYYNSGANPYTPFDVIGAGGVGYMEEGIDAPDSLAVLDNAPFWIGGNANGGGIAWRANGYTPLRVSNHALETTWAGYPKGASDAVGYSYRDRGHTFWVLRFPSANGGLGATWAYDTATQMWAERGYWSQQGPTGYSAYLPTCHCRAFGKDLVGDWSSGNIYALDATNPTDNGVAIRYWRRSPHIASERQWITFHELEVVMQVGDGPLPPLEDGEGNARDPQAMLRWSNDGGRTWGAEHWTGMGQAGEFLTRVRWVQMGTARDRVYDLVITDPIAPKIIEGDLRATPGFPMPTERYTKQIAKIT